MRWSQGVWSERRVREAVENSGDFFALSYGPSSTAPEEDVRAFEEYFERLEAAGLGDVKRPDLLIFSRGDREAVDSEVAALGGEQELPFTPEDRLKGLLSHAIIAVECENSLWRAAQMPDYGAEMKPMKRLGGKSGLRKNAVLPTVIIKEEDREPLRRWEADWEVPIHIWHVFFDMAFGLALSRIEQLIADGLVEGLEQVFQAPGGATTRKVIYKIPYHYAYELGQSVEEPQLSANSITDKNGHILPYVCFEGGCLALSEEALGGLRRLMREAH